MTTMYFLPNGTVTMNESYARSCYHRLSNYATRVITTIPRKWPLKHNLHPKQVVDMDNQAYADKVRRKAEKRLSRKYSVKRSR
jgi:hypothetical protein